MAVLADRVIGTIGGGHLEHQAWPTRVAAWRASLASRRCAMPWAPPWASGCGGVVHLQFEAAGPGRCRQPARPPARPARARGPVWRRRRRPRPGAGVGAAAFALTWIDSRDGISRPIRPRAVVCEHSEARAPGRAHAASGLARAHRELQPR